MNENEVTIRGRVATTPVEKVGAKGGLWVQFRVGSTPSRRIDHGGWADDPTSWYTVKCFRALALNALTSLKTGQPVVIMGRLHIHEFDRRDGAKGLEPTIEATTLGHDLRYGKAEYVRTGYGADAFTRPVPAAPIMNTAPGDGEQPPVDFGADPGPDTPEVQVDDHAALPGWLGGYTDGDSLAGDSLAAGDPAGGSDSEGLDAASEGRGEAAA